MSERRKDAWEKSECLREGRLFWEECDCMRDLAWEASSTIGEAERDLECSSRASSPPASDMRQVTCRHAREKYGVRTALPCPPAPKAHLNFSVGNLQAPAAQQITHFSSQGCGSRGETQRARGARCARR